MEMLRTLNLDETILVDTTAEAPDDGWQSFITMQLVSVSAEFVEVGMNFTSWITLDEEYEAVLAAQEAVAKEAAAASPREQKQLIIHLLQHLWMNFNTSAALIQCEAGGQYTMHNLRLDVVMNRIRSGAYPNTVYDVIYQRGQFGPLQQEKLKQNCKWH